jgi:hypothetical protein
MPTPQLLKSGAPTVTFTKARAFPTSAPQQPNQIIGEAEGGQVKVAELGPEHQLITAVFERVPSTDVDALFTFLNHDNVRWSLNTITWRDDAAVDRTVRYWGPFPLEPRQVASGLYSFEILLRVEIA